MKPLRDWNRFFFDPQPTRVLGAYRIAIGILTLYSFLLFAKDATTFFSDRGVIAVSTCERMQEREWHSVLAVLRTPAGVNCTLVALFLVAVSFTAGFYTRASSILLYILVTSFHERNPLVMNSGDSVLRTMLFFFMFAPAGKSYSVDSIRRRRAGFEPEPTLAAPWAQRMMQIQVAVIYFTTAYAKSRGDLYHNGSAMYYAFGLVDFNVHGVENLMNYPVVYSAMTFGMLFIEISFPFLIWFRASRPYAIAMGILLHLWIMWCMTLPVFGILMIATYLCFLTDEEFSALVAWIRARLLRLERFRSRLKSNGDECHETRPTSPGP